MKYGIILLSLLFVSCASRKTGPIVKHDTISDAAKVESDVNNCKLEADQIMAQQSSKGEGARGALKGSAKGAAVGGIASSINGNSSQRNKKNAKIGAGVGAVAGLARAKEEKKNIARRMQSDCLNKKGYKIYGWN